MPGPFLNANFSALPFSLPAFSLFQGNTEGGGSRVITQPPTSFNLQCPTASKAF